MQTRFVHTCISSLLFSGETTLDELHTELAHDAQDLFENGVVAASLQFRNMYINVALLVMYSTSLGPAKIDEQGTRLFFACIGVKGDQVFVRKATLKRLAPLSAWRGLR